MKYLFLLLLLPFCLSCSSDDNSGGGETSVNVEEKIIGTWQLIGREPNGIEYCELSNTLQFSEQYDFFIEVSIGDEPSECQSASLFGSWEYLGNNQIKINLNGIEENTIMDISFFDNSTGMKVHNSSDEEGHYETYAKQ
ncbi:MAG TPA: hypothetical protein VFM82_07020 [Flavobacteriaceae bacterium]|nr:hypothetical protein [Flavobacteriaceae bacterium]